MDQSNPTKLWLLLIIRGLLYVAIGAISLFLIRALTSQAVQLLGSLVIAAGACGCIYAFFTLRADRNYFWELLRSFFDIGFGIALLVFSRDDVNRVIETLGFWAIMYAFIQAVQAIYTAMLLGVKQPRNIFGNVLHLLTVLLAGGLAYELMSSASQTISFTLVGLLVVALGVIIILQAVQQRRTLLFNKPA